MLSWAKLIKFTGSLKHKKKGKDYSSAHAVKVPTVGDKKCLPGTPFFHHMLPSQFLLDS